MARVNLSLPPEFIFQTELPVRITDINYGGHLGNDAVLSLIHESRYRFINQLGYEDELSLENDTGIIIADSVIVYKAEAFHGDLLQIHIAAADFNRYGMDLFYLLLNKRNEKEIARAKTGIVCLNYLTKKISRAPEEFITRIRELQPYTI